MSGNASHLPARVMVVVMMMMMGGGGPNGLVASP